MKKRTQTIVVAIVAFIPLIATSRGDTAPPPPAVKGTAGENSQTPETHQPGLALKIGVVDMKRIFAEFHKTTEAEKTINEGKSVAKRELDEINARFKQLISDWQKAKEIAADPSINDLLSTQKTNDANEIAAEAKHLERELAELRQRREKQLQEKLMRLRKGLLAEIQATVSDIAREQDYDIVFDGAGMGINGVPFLLHSKSAVDFSNAVLAELNPKKALAGDSKPRP